MNLVRFSNAYFLLSGLLIGLSVAALAYFGLLWSIEFTGGSIMEVHYQESRPPVSEIRSLLGPLQLKTVQVQEAGDKGALIRTESISEQTHQHILRQLGQGVSEARFDAVGPVIGKELKRTTAITALLALSMIVLYIALAFRKISDPFKPWHWSIVSLAALLHDVLLPLGLLAVLGKIYGIEFTIPVVVALLTVIGYSINNNIVVFDRIRENLLKHAGFDLQDTINKSIQQTFTRNINMTLTVLISLFSLLFFGGQAMQGFSLALIAGTLVGLYSSIFFCPAMLASWLSRDKGV